MTTLIKKFDELRKYVATPHGKELAKEFRRALKNLEKYADKLDLYFSDTMDGMSPEQSAKENRLL